MKAIYTLTVSFLIAITVSAPVQATDFTGAVGTLRITQGDSGPRVVFSMPGLITSCGVSAWYAFENADTGIGKLWTAMLMTAQSQGKNVLVRGTGVCQSLTAMSGSIIEIEGVNAIDLSE